MSYCKSDDLYYIGLAIINSLDMAKIYWFFIEMGLVNIADEYDENDSENDITIIAKVIENENLMILDFLDSQRFDFNYLDLEHAALHGKLSSFKHLLTLKDGLYNLQISWSFAIAVENKKYNIINYLINNFSYFHTIEQDVGRSEVNEASFRLGMAFDINMVNHLINLNHFDPIACIIGALVNRDINSINLIKSKCNINNQYILQNMVINPINECVSFRPVDLFTSLY